MTSLSEKKVQLDLLMPAIRECLAEGRTVRFNPKGVSMLPMLHQGVDTVVLSPVPEKLKKYDLPLYQRDNGQYVLHRIVKAEQSYTCCGDNQFVPEPGIRRDQMIAVVSSFTHRGRMITVGHPCYRLYCRYWCFSRPVRKFAGRVAGRLRRMAGK